MMDVDVSFDNVSGLIVVECAVNGTPLRFVVDTGASHTIITAKAAATLSLTPGESQPVMGAGGQVGAAPVQVESFKWGDTELFDVSLFRVELDTVCGLVSGDIAGVIGADLLRGHRLTVDYPEQRLTLASVAS